MAGESAEAVAQAQLDRARRLHESARRFQQGAIGERATATALEALPGGWVVLHDLAWPGRQRANIDHVVVGPPGVVVVDSKNWTGRTTFESGVLRQGGRDRSTSVWGVEAAASALADAVTFLPRADVRAALCFTGQGDLTGFVGSVLVVSDTQLVPALLARPAVLTPRQVWEYAEMIRERVGTATADRPLVRRPPRPRTPMTPPVPSARTPAGRPVERAGQPAPSPSARPVARPRSKLVVLAVGLMVAGGLTWQPQLLSDAASKVGSFITGVATAEAEPSRPPVADEPTTREARQARQERRERRQRRQARAAERAQVSGEGGLRAQAGPGQG